MSILASRHRQLAGDGEGWGRHGLRQRRCDLSCPEMMAAESRERFYARILGEEVKRHQEEVERLRGRIKELEHANHYGYANKT